MSYVQREVVPSSRHRDGERAVAKCLTSTVKFEYNKHTRIIRTLNLDGKIVGKC